MANNCAQGFFRGILNWDSDVYTNLGCGIQLLFIYFFHSRMMKTRSRSISPKKKINVQKEIEILDENSKISSIASSTTNVNDASTLINQIITDPTMLHH